MKLKKLNQGVFRVNNYILFDEETKDAVLIDAGGDFAETKAAIDEFGANLKYLLNTHSHMDHIAGDEEIQRNYDIPIYMHKDDEVLLKAFKESLRMFDMPDYELPKSVTFINDGQVFKLGNKEIKTIHTPGHTKGGVSYLIDDMLFSGDTLFFESIGRTDLYGGNYNQLISSVKDKLFVLPDNTKVYPGHGIESTIGHEKENNAYVH